MNISSSTPDIIELSQKSIDYILKNSQDGTDISENLKTAVSMTLEQVNNKANARKSAEESVISSFAAHRDLVKRIEFAREIGKNTLNKMTHGFPQSLSWLNTRGRISVVGVFRREYSIREPKYTDITDKLISGSVQLGSLDVVRFSATHFNGGGVVAELPLEALRNDPMAVSQMVRKACRLHAEKEFNARTQNLSKRIADLKREYEQNLSKLNKESKASVVPPIKPAFKARPVRPRKPVTA